MLFGEHAVHVTSEQDNWFDLNFGKLRIVHLGNVALDLLVFAQLLEKSDLILGAHSHALELARELQYTRHALQLNVLINKVSEHLTRLEVDTTDIDLALLELGVEPVRDDNDYDDEESEEHLQLEVLLLEELRQSDTNSEGTLTIRVTVLDEVVSSLLVSHDSVSLGDLNEFIDGLWVVGVLIRMFFARQFTVCLFHLGRSSIKRDTKKLVRNELLERLKVLDGVKANVRSVPHDNDDHQTDDEPAIEPRHRVGSASLLHTVQANFALAVLKRAIDAKLAEEHGSQNEAPCGRDEQDKQQG